MVELQRLETEASQKALRLLPFRLDAPSSPTHLLIGRQQEVHVYQSPVRHFIEHYLTRE